MKILALSNLYPPSQIGGYEMLCQDVLQALATRGHEVHVLTSNYQSGSTAESSDAGLSIERSLQLESDVHYYKPSQLLRHPAEVRWNWERLRQSITRVQPDLIFVWGMWNLSKTLAEEAERLMPGRVAYYLANAWPIEPSMHRVYWENTETTWRGRSLKRVGLPLARRVCADVWGLPRCRFERAMCCSFATQNQIIVGGVPLADPVVVYEGIDLAEFSPEGSPAVGSPEGQLRIAFVGTLVAHKGPHTAIEALAVLKRRNAPVRVALTILGRGHPDYESRLRNRASAEGLTNGGAFSVQMITPIPRSELADFIRSHDALVMPSIWEEPLARIMQDTLACGVPLVATPTGGTKEVIVDGVNGLLFPPEDAEALADRLMQLAGSRPLRGRLGAEGRRTAERMFSMNVMVEHVERELDGLLAAHNG
jgi:glycosyltransferase involved in cell wall biosynthesis